LLAHFLPAVAGERDRVAVHVRRERRAAAQPAGRGGSVRWAL
jgi:hypothetical protein